MRFAPIGIVSIVAAVALVSCSSSGDADGGSTADASSTTAPPAADAAALELSLFDDDGRLAFPAPRLAEQVAIEPDSSGGAQLTFSVAYGVAHPGTDGGAKPDEALITVEVARSMMPSAPQPADPVFSTVLSDDELSADEVTKDYAVELPADAYSHLQGQGIGSDDAAERAAALGLVNVRVQQFRDFQVVDGTADWIHGTAFNAAMSATAPSDNPGGSVTVINNTANGISAYDWSAMDPVGQEYGPQLIPNPQLLTTVADSSPGVTVVTAGQAMSCLYQGEDGSNPAGLTATLAPNAAVTQKIVADDEQSSEPTGSDDTTGITNTVIESIQAGLQVVSALTGELTGPYAAVLNMVEDVFDLSTACNNQPNIFQLGAATEDGLGVANTAWAIYDGCSGTCGGLSNLYSSPWSSSASDDEAAMAVGAVQLAPDTGVTYEGQPLWLAQVPVSGGCGVGDASDSNTSGCTSQNVISLQWMTSAPCPMTNGMENGNGYVDSYGGVSACFSTPVTSPEIPVCGTNNAQCLPYDPTGS